MSGAKLWPLALLLVTLGFSSVPFVFAVALFSRERRRTFFYVCVQAFFCVFALEEQLLVLALDGERSFERDLPAGLHGALDSAHGLRSFVWRTELTRVLEHVLHEAVALKDVV